jgi:hypothetical protein
MIALDFVQIELERCGSFRCLCVTRLDLTEDFTLVAKQDDAPAALHPPGKLRGAVFLGGATGGHAANLGGRGEESNRNAALTQRSPWARFTTKALSASPSGVCVMQWGAA